MTATVGNTALMFYTRLMLSSRVSFIAIKYRIELSDHSLTVYFFCIKFMIARLRSFFLRR